MAKCSAVLPTAFWWFTLAPRASSSSHMRRLRFCAATMSSEFPRSSSRLGSTPRASASSTRLIRLLRTCEKTVSLSGSSLSWFAFSSSLIRDILPCSCALRGSSRSRLTVILRTCSGWLTPSICWMSLSRRSMRNFPSTDPSRKACTYWGRFSVVSHRPTSSTVQSARSSGNARSSASSASRLARCASASAARLRALAAAASSAPAPARPASVTVGRAAAWLTAAAARAASAAPETAACVVSAFMSRIWPSMFRPLK
mmetsp:Transcript_39131/g.64412  ORF Transcript_39131/g.64412 Transcript_39131/m.64412 type:complete len:257 (-) Transcript_39131:317-1087(-)